MDIFKIVNGKKYMWDGEDYNAESAAREHLLEYNDNGFETVLIEEGGKYFVYSRRLVTEIVIDD